jgi:Fe2+ or Zn2+ uptake regulation protein
MSTKDITTRHQEVISELKKEHLTSFQILKRMNNTSLILVVYNILDELKSMGILHSYVKENTKYHYTG